MTSSFITSANSSSAFYKLDGARPKTILQLGASAANITPYVPIMMRGREEQAVIPQHPYKASSPRPLSRNQRRKRNSRNPPSPSPFLPPTVQPTEPPQPALFPENGNDNDENLTNWMNAYNPFIINNLSLSIRQDTNEEFNYEGDFVGWCQSRGLGVTAPSS